MRADRSRNPGGLIKSFTFPLTSLTVTAGNKTGNVVPFIDSRNRDDCA